MNRVAGKVALITGSGTGIGKAAAVLYAQEGASVILMGRREPVLAETAQEIRSRGGRAFPIVGDITDEESIQHVLVASFRECGRIDILVNNAGVALRSVQTHEVTDEDWEQAIRINLTGTFRMVRAVLPHFVSRRQGVIVNISSISALVGMPNMSAYSVAKSGVVALTRCVAVEYGPLGIRCNCICPGTTRTPMTSGMLSDAAICQQISSSNLQRRIGSPSEIAQSILYLGSDESSFITGSVLIADGGYTAI